MLPVMPVSFLSVGVICIPVLRLSVFSGCRYASSAGHVSQILGTMLKGQHDTWTGWVEMKPIAKQGAEAIKGDAGNGGSGPITRGTRLQLNLHFAPMDT